MDAQPVVSTTPEKDVEREQEMLTLKEELTTQEALRMRESVCKSKQLKKRSRE